MSEQKPSIGRVVHYVSYGTPGGEYPSVCRAAIVTEVDLGVPKTLGGERVGLAVLNPSGMFFHSLAEGGCKYHDGSGLPGDPDCPNAFGHGNPMRYCACGWTEPTLLGGTWHWPERVE